MNIDEIVDVEMSRPKTESVRVPNERGTGWSLAEINHVGTWWVREYRNPLVVDLVQWSGTMLASQTTGKVITLFVARYWWLYWQTWWRRRHPQIPRATVVRR